MKYLFLVFFSIILLMGCNSTLTDVKKDGLKGNVVCLYEETGVGNFITEYVDGRMIKSVWINPDEIVVEKIYIYSNNILQTIETTTTTHNGVKKSQTDESNKPVSQDITKEDPDSHYKYDNKGNWIERRWEKDGESHIVNRKIYYKGEDYKDIISQYESMKSSLMSSNPDETNSPNYQENNEYQQPSNNQSRSGQWITCSKCGGTGKAICYDCGGRGIVECPQCHGRGYTYNDRSEKVTCYVCNGRGTIRCETCFGKGNTGECPICHGKGSVFVNNP